MRWSDVSFDPPAKTVRQFAGLWLAVFAGLAVWHGYRAGDQTLLWVFGALAVAVGLPGLVWPRVVKPVFVAAMVLTFPVGWVVSRLVLGALFFGLFTPIGLVFRLSGRDPLDRRYSPECDSYWEPKPAVHDAKRYFRQF